MATEGANLRSTGTRQFNNESSVTDATVNLAVPSGVVEGDLLIAYLLHTTAVSVTALGSGWTKVNTWGFSLNYMTVFTRIATASEPATHNFEATGTLGADSGFGGFVQRWDLHNASQPVEFYTENTGQNGATTGFTAVGGTASEINCVRVIILTVSDINLFGWPTGFTSQDNIGSGGFGWRSLATDIASTTIPNYADTIDMGSNDWWSAGQLVIKPAADETLGNAIMMGANF